MKLLPILIALILSGCATGDPARYIEHHCPVKYVEGDREALATLHRKEWNGKGKALMTYECYGNAETFKKWASVRGIEGEILPYRNGTHVAFTPFGSKYYVDYQEGIGTVRRKIK